MYLFLSPFAPAAFSSMLKVGLRTRRRNPALNSIRLLLGTISLFSNVLASLKCIVEILHSCGNRVDRTIA